MSLKVPKTFLKMSKKSPGSNARAASFKTADFSWGTLS